MLSLELLICCWMRYLGSAVVIDVVVAGQEGGYRAGRVAMVNGDLTKMILVQRVEEA